MNYNTKKVFYILFFFTATYSFSGEMQKLDKDEFYSQQSSQSLKKKKIDFSKKIFKFNDNFYHYTVYPIYNFSSSNIPLEFLWLFKISGKNYFDTTSDVVLSLLDLDFEAFSLSFELVFCIFLQHHL